MVNITYIKGHPGAGKTLNELTSMITVPGKYVYAGSRTALIDEAVAFLTKRGIRCEIEAIYADQDGRGSKNVDQRIESFIERNSDSIHAILLITHAGLRDADQRQFEGYKLVIDELPSGAVFTNRNQFGRGSVTSHADLNTIYVFTVEVCREGIWAPIKDRSDFEMCRAIKISDIFKMYISSAGKDDFQGFL